MLYCGRMSILDEQRLEELTKLASPLTLTLEKGRYTADELEIIIGYASPKTLLSASNLKWYQQFGTGAEWLSEYPELKLREFILTSVSDNHCVPLAEHAFAFILAFTRQLAKAWKAQSELTWWRPDNDDKGLWDLDRKKMLILGYGSIGREVAKLAVAFGIEVTAVRSSVSSAVIEDVQICDFANCRNALNGADIVVNTLPLAPTTKKIVNREFLGGMKAGGFFVNVGRGGTVDECALVEALANGHIGGAGLDVFCEEPLSKDSPLWKLENVMITAHYAGASESIYHRFYDVAIDNLKRYNNGDRMRNMVDKRRVY